MSTFFLSSVMLVPLRTATVRSMELSMTDEILALRPATPKVAALFMR
jgi:hypothetical protein